MGGASQICSREDLYCTNTALHYDTPKIQKQKQLMRENFKLKNKKERVNKKESVEGDPGEEEKEEEGEKEKEKEKPENPKKIEEEKKKKKRKKENLVRQRQYGKFLHNREGDAHIFTHVQAHTHGKYTVTLSIITA